MSKEDFRPDDIVRSCPKLESGLNLCFNGLRACTRGALMPPLFCSAEQIVSGEVTKEFIVQKRQEYLRMLNDDHSEMDCKRCLMVEQKRYGDIDFSRLGHVDLQHYTICNLRCSYCAYTRDDLHYPPQYDALAVLGLFTPDEVEWNAHVDFAGGEPTLLPNLEQFLDFFRERRLRVMMYTNAVRFHDAIYNGLADGSIYFVTTSLDAGTPGTYRALRGRDYYLRVMENLSRYAAAGSRGKGMLAVKYIFCADNSTDDDVAGFAYAMLALRPQQVWLTFDFAPMYLRQGGYDFSRQIDAYARLYLLLKKHGVEPFHYFKEAIATVSGEGGKIMERLLAAIESHAPAAGSPSPDLIFPNFREEGAKACAEPDKFSVNPLRLYRGGGEAQHWSLEGKRVLLVPACPLTRKLLAAPDLEQAQVVGFVDRNPVQQGKRIDGRLIYGYEAISSLEADLILVAAPEKHRSDILRAVSSHAPAGAAIAEFVETD